MNDASNAGGGIARRRLIQSLAAAPFLGVAGGAAMAAQPAQAHDLAAVWRRALDPDDKGEAARWYATELADKLPLPGTLEQHRIGHPVAIDTPWTGDINDKGWFTATEDAPYRVAGQVKVPFFLQPDSWYRGAAWYQRDIDIPTDWRGKRIELFLERAHWETRVWIDDLPFGRSEALHVPHRYDLGALAPGRHRLTIRVDNRMIVDIGHNGHGVTDHTQGNWNGIAGRIELRASEAAWIDRIDILPRFADRTLVVRGIARRLENAPSPRQADLRVGGRTVRMPVTWQGKEGRFEARLQIHPEDPAARPWDEFDPVLHDVTVRLANGADWQGRFGWRDLVGGPDGFRLNGRPIMFRGALDCSIFPLTGHPPTEIAPWRRIMRRIKDYGLNHIRFHSYCPPQAALDAADEAGVYVQVEMVWANQSTVIGSGKPVDAWVHAETDRILAEHGNHPCIVLMTHGNEPGGGDRAGEARRDAWLADYVRKYRGIDPRRLWTSGSGWPQLPENQFHVTPDPRIQAWGEELKSRINAKPPETRTDYADYIGKRAVPVISHEMGQWCVYPNLEERRKYTGHLKARNFDIFEDRLRASGLHDLAPEFHHASGRLQVMCYKEDIESALRTHRMGGFQLLGLQDFSGQGTALVGVVDPFWDDKGYVTGEEYRRFCGAVVPLARLPRRVFRSEEQLEFSLDIANFSAAPIQAAQIAWRVEDAGGRRIAEGSFAEQRVPNGNAPLSLTARAPLTTTRATAARLIVTVRENGRPIAENDWDLWIYPSATPAPSAGISRADRIDEAVLARLDRGERVLIGLSPDRIANYPERPVKLGFSSIFWSTLWTNQQAPTTLGVYCDPKHPALADFPTEAHSNWQWWYPMHRAGALRLDLLPAGVEPIVRVIDDWFTARPLGLIVEVAVGKGRAIVCGFGLDAEDPVSRQLVASLEAYMASGAFRPEAQVTPRQLRALSGA
ncbi:glycoside hydrolase [Sphingomonas elodea]|uniref:glycoside hydrolase n=1 Tax=Sphingomonas elodea TaxID=179878 RepID=UPI0002630AAD|nr:glycoside hydrolase [Sphingomonas elodea]